MTKEIISHWTFTPSQINKSYWEDSNSFQQTLDKDQRDWNTCQQIQSLKHQNWLLSNNKQDF